MFIGSAVRNSTLLSLAKEVKKTGNLDSILNDKFITAIKCIITSSQLPSEYDQIVIQPSSNRTIRYVHGPRNIPARLYYMELPKINSIRVFVKVSLWSKKDEGRGYNIISNF
ncbi:hypothetical protein IPJ91_00135 [bacterium]|nr:MAG: hypothetical protein IPJ91_00135 [bacterium]